VFHDADRQLAAEDFFEGFLVIADFPQFEMALFDRGDIETIVFFSPTRSARASGPASGCVEAFGDP